MAVARMDFKKVYNSLLRSTSFCLYKYSIAYEKKKKRGIIHLVCLFHDPFFGVFLVEI